MIIARGAVDKGYLPIPGRGRGRARSTTRALVALLQLARSLPPRASSPLLPTCEARDRSTYFIRRGSRSPNSDESRELIRENDESGGVNSASKLPKSFVRSFVSRVFSFLGTFFFG